MRTLCTVLLIAVCAAASSCRSAVDRQIRTDPAVVETSITALENTTKARTDAAKASVERHHESDPRYAGGDFQLAIVEFGDDGTAWSAEQRQLVLDTVTESSKSTGIVLVVFVHGWRHNATVCDDNVACFRRVLQSFALREQQITTQRGLPPRAVVGVYVGWRGKSSCTEPLTTTSIWRRKSIGESLGARSGREVLRQLMRSFGPIREKHPDSRLIIAGHSLGAGVVFSAVGPIMEQRLHDGIKQAEAKPDRVVPVIGDVDVIQNAERIPLPDLVLLLNPAFEAQLYKPIQRQLSYMAANKIHFDEKQPPLMLTISSPHDGATKGIFFLGQFLEAAVTPVWWFHGPAYLVRNMLTPPHFAPYITDKAVLLGEPLKSRQGSNNGSNCFSGMALEDAKSQIACACAELTPEQLENVKAQTASYARAPQAVQFKTQQTYNTVRLDHLRGDPNNPFLVVTAAWRCSRIACGVPPANSARSADRCMDRAVRCQ